MRDGEQHREQQPKEEIDHGVCLFGGYATAFAVRVCRSHVVWKALNEKKPDVLAKGLS